MKKVYVIGAGPAGLTAAYELLRQSREYEVIVLEESDAMGGISKTVNYKGNRMDMGGHRFFSKVPEVNDWWERMLPAQGAPSYDDIVLRREMPLAPGGPDPEKEDHVMLRRHRVSRIYFNRKFFDYPITLKPETFINMGFLATVQAGFSYLASMIHKRKENSLEDFYVNRFGKKLYSMFFENYTENLWGRHPSEIAPDWGAQRAKGLSVGSCHGKVRAMMDDNGRRVKEAGPSKPVEILGLNDVPGAGEIFVSPETDKEARAFAETYVKESREKLIEDTKLKMSLDDLYSQIQSGNLKELNIIVKADVQGSVEAVKQSLLKLSNEEVVVKIIHGGVGAINESDVSLASASNAIIIGFNVRPDATAKETAEREKVDLRLYRVIYDAINDVEAAMKGMLDPIFEEKVLGHAEVRQIFKASGIGNIAGSYVLDGVFQRNCKCRITREGTQIFDGALASLKRFKDDVKEVRAGYECGLVFEKFNDIQELDIVEAYTMVEVPR